MSRPLLILFAVSLAVGQPAESSEKVRVEGKVVSVTGQAISKAEMRVPLASVATDGEGKFVFKGVPVGRHTLSAEKAGFKQDHGVALNLKAGMDLTDLVVKLTPQGVITGTVTDQDGDPVATVDVSAMRYESVSAPARLRALGRTNVRVARNSPGVCNEHAVSGELHSR